MNYLRGAVNAISVPYQYYRDLNPSTLTGAIDVIVISRPKQPKESDGQNDTTSSSPPPKDEERELLCSPFHVRFGKWQVLRPGDKKVDVYVNGNLVPFPMKIGEAGEAFFVFEADGSIPDDLVTSPLLEATKPGQSNADTQRIGRFGAKDDSKGAGSPGKTAEPYAASQEPDFLDLNASSQDDTTKPESSAEQQPILSSAPPSKVEGSSPSLLARTAHLGKAVLSAAVETEKSQRDKLKDLSLKHAFVETEKDTREFIQDQANAARNLSGLSTEEPPVASDKGDEALPDGGMDKGQPPDVEYTDNVVLDMDGYHANKLPRSHGLSLSMDSDAQSVNPEQVPGPSRTPSPPSSPETYASDSIRFPPMRATSEPPPDMSFPPRSSNNSGVQFLSDGPSTTEFPRTEVDPHTALPPLAIPSDRPETQAYMWDWGAFPQKTPVQTTFVPRVSLGAGDDVEDKLAVRRKGKGRLEPDDSIEADDDRALETPPLIASSSKAPPPTQELYGSGGRLFADHRDPKRFKVLIEGRTVDFELSIVELGPREEHMTRGDKQRGPLGGADEVEDDRRFEEGKISFAHFLADDNLVKDEDLVLKWGGAQYITRQDASPLMDSLRIWRELAIKHKYSHRLSRSMSHGLDTERSRIQEEEDENWSSDDRTTSKHISTDFHTPVRKTVTEPSIDGNPSSSRKPTSSSWVRWWSRSRQAESVRPDLNSVNSAPSDVEGKSVRAPDELQSNKRSPPATSAPVSRQTHDQALSVKTTDDAMNVPAAPRKRYAKTLRLTSDQLKSLNLKPGANTITFSLSATGVTACTARLFVWDHTDLIVISDIDGTITKSDALGHVFTMIGRDWTHLGVAKLYTDICRNGYKILYLTSRAIGQADSTRDYLKGIKQNDYQLPEGPVIMSPDRLLTSLHREVIMRKPEVFKMACLRDIRRLFGSSARNPFYAGFGNRITDALSYRSVDVPSSRIFTIDSSGEVKMELLELAGYKSSYIHMTDLVDQMFPPIHKKWAAEYTDFNYWKAPMQDFSLPDLSPPSPALSARSDTSTQSTLARLRNFSLVGTRQTNNAKQFNLPPGPATIKVDEDRRKESQLRQMSSFERLSNTLVAFAQSSSSPAGSPGTTTPTYVDSASEEEDDELDLEKGGGRPRPRTRSMSSMPGSLPGSSGSMSDEELHFGRGDDDEGEYDGEEEEEAAEETFDEDILATGEMQKVPFL